MTYQSYGDLAHWEDILGSGPSAEQSHQAWLDAHAFVAFNNLAMEALDHDGNQTSYVERDNFGDDSVLPEDHIEWWWGLGVCQIQDLDFCEHLEESPIQPAIVAVGAMSDRAVCRQCLPLLTYSRETCHRCAGPTGSFMLIHNIFSIGFIEGAATPLVLLAEVCDPCSETWPG